MEEDTGCSHQQMFGGTKKEQKKLRCAGVVEKK